MSQTAESLPAGGSTSSLEWRALLLLLAVVLVARAFYLPTVAGYGLDGGLYFEVARHVRDGDGLVSSLSLYHQGFQSFPRPTPLYPLWPLLLGLMGRIVPLERLAVGLPVALHLLSVILGFRAVKVIEQRLGLPPLWRGGPVVLTAALLFALALGLNSRYFHASARPYTESLSWCLLLLAVPRLLRSLGRPGVLSGLEAGAWAGLLVLARSQLLLVTLALGGALGIRLLTVWVGLDPQGSRAERWSASRHILAALLGGTVGWLGVVSLQLLQLYAHGIAPSLTALLRFDLYRDLDVLSPLPLMVQTHGLLGWLRDRTEGFWLAFNPAATEGYRGGVGLFFLSVPAVSLVLLGRLGLAAGRVWKTSAPGLRARGLWEAGRSKSGALRVWLSGEQLPELFLGLLMLGGWLSLHTLHKTMFSEWNFSTRHAMTALPFFVACLCWLFYQGRWVRRLAVLLLLISVGYAGNLLGANCLEGWHKPPPQVQRQAKGLAEYLRKARQEDPDLRVAVWEPQLMAPLAPGVGFHWLGASTQAADLVILFDVLETDLLALEIGGPSMEFLKVPGFLVEYFVPVSNPPPGWRLFRRRRD